MVEELTKKNIFNYYSQKENNFTKALINVMENAFSKGDKVVVNNFLKLLIPNITYSDDIEFGLLKGMDGGTYDAKISSKKKSYYLAIEAKIKERRLRKDQLQRHCINLKKQSDYKTKLLVAITPDIDKGNFIKTLSSIKCNSKHLSWKSIFESFKEIRKEYTTSETTAFLIEQFNDLLDGELLNTSSGGGIVKATKAYFPKWYEKEIFTGKEKIWGMRGLFSGMKGGDKVMVIYKSETHEIIGEAIVKDIEEIKKPKDWALYNYIFLKVDKYPKPIPRNKLERMFRDKFFSGRASFRYITKDELELIRNEAGYIVSKERIYKNSK